MSNEEVHSSLITHYSSLRSRYTPIVLWACFFYLGHLVFQARTAPSEIGAFAAWYWTLWAIARRQMRASFHIVEFPLVLFALATTISVCLPGHPKMGGQVIIPKILLFFAAIIILREVPEMRRLSLVAHAFVATWIASVGIFQFFALHQRDLEHRITGNSTHVMTYSGLLLPLSLLFGILWLHERKWWMLGTAAISTYALLLTYTRSAWLAWVVAVFAVLVLPRP